MMVKNETASRDRSSRIMNYFGHETAAERYAQSRPYFHRLVIERIRGLLKLEGPVRIALDVGCGTGQSALALAEIALAIYSNGFFGRMNENPEFSRWHRESYLTRYPTPPRDDRPFTERDARDILSSRDGSGTRTRFRFRESNWRIT
jgi:SAM-dependent methyltransferase